MVMGDDFRYNNAHQNFFYLDHFIEYINKYYGNKYYLRYSNPEDYIDALKREKDIKWPVKYDDLFPYSDRLHSYWTGYFSSKSNDKQMIRKTSGNFHMSSQLYSEKVLD